ncbi:hypothetical protein M5K25_012627 [Dendrobium thyrsiflorum]|uniref:Uncharacterized protein n=1 Tax=Dendrobium thyrsiflorum TaxID=117978 RepID=A0ABD0UYH1_DENTH
MDALEERSEGEMSQIKAMVEDRISSVENKVSDLHAMIKQLLDNQTAASEAKEPVGKTTNSVYCRRDDEVEIMEEQGERYGGRHRYGEQGSRGAGWEGKERGCGRKGADFEEKERESEEGFRVKSLQFFSLAQATKSKKDKV